MNDHPQIQCDVVIPCYNAAATLNESVESVLNQSFPDFRLFLVDDGSTDNTLDIARQLEAVDSHITVIARAENRGAGQYLAESNTIVVADVRSWGGCPVCD